MIMRSALQKLMGLYIINLYDWLWIFKSKSPHFMVYFLDTLEAFTVTKAMTIYTYSWVPVLHLLLIPSSTASYINLLFRFFLMHQFVAVKYCMFC